METLLYASDDPDFTINIGSLYAENYKTDISKQVAYKRLASAFSVESNVSSDRMLETHGLIDHARGIKRDTDVASAPFSFGSVEYRPSSKLSSFMSTFNAIPAPLCETTAPKPPQVKVVKEIIEKTVPGPPMAVAAAPQESSATKPGGFASAADMLYGANGPHKQKKEQQPQPRPTPVGGKDDEEGKSKILEELGLEDTNLEEKHVDAVLRMRVSGPKSVVRESDIAGLASTKQLVRESIIEPVLRPDIFQGLLAAPLGVLMFGPPGCGKTTIAKWVATESGATFFEVSPSALTSKFYGESEKMVRALWKVATALAPSVIFIDEIDCLLGQRNEKEEDSTIRMKNELLQMMDGVGSDPTKLVVVVGATNRPGSIDDAARRRLSKRVLVPLPDFIARRDQVKNLLKSAHSLSDDELAKAADLCDGFNGSDIKDLCKAAALIGHREMVAQYGGIVNVPRDVQRRPVTFADFEAAVQTIKPSVDRSALGEFERFEQNFGSG